LEDKKSEEIMSMIDYDFSKFKSGWFSYYGILARAKTMDDQVKKFISEKIFPVTEDSTLSLVSISNRK